VRAGARRINHNNSAQINTLQLASPLKRRGMLVGYLHSMKQLIEKAAETPDIGPNGPYCRGGRPAAAERSPAPRSRRSSDSASFF
jgi:hypothetical protein